MQTNIINKINQTQRSVFSINSNIARKWRKENNIVMAHEHPLFIYKDENPIKILKQGNLFNPLENLSKKINVDSQKKITVIIASESSQGNKEQRPMFNFKNFENSLKKLNRNAFSWQIPNEKLDELEKNSRNDPEELARDQKFKELVENNNLNISHGPLFNDFLRKKENELKIIYINSLKIPQNCILPDNLFQGLGLQFGHFKYTEQEIEEYYKTYSEFLTYLLNIKDIDEGQEKTVKKILEKHLFFESKLEQIQELKKNHDFQRSTKLIDYEPYNVLKTKLNVIKNDKIENRDFFEEASCNSIITDKDADEDE